MKEYERINEKERIVEMAKVGRVGQLLIEVFTDHNPPHFHVIKKGQYNVRILIPNSVNESLVVLSYKWQKSGKEILSLELSSISDWLAMPHHKAKTNSNLVQIEVFWDSMN